jgi:antitoxin MazE
MNQHVKKWGNSLAVRIPAPLSSEVGLKEDDAVEVRAEDGRIVIEKKRRKRPTLDDLLAGVTPENIHAETDWGPPVGREVW